jgi:hypothetical protein
MEIPNLVRERLGGESIEATVSLGDEDVICVTPTRTFLYRGEGLLSDESVEVYDHDVDRIALSEGRRNTKFVLEYVDGTEEFKVPSGRADTLLKILLQGVLRVAGVAAVDESVAGVYQFSELTLVVTEARLVKHVGASVWDEDFEVFDYADVTALDFEEGSVATQIVLTVGGRPQRIKAPNDEAPQVEQTLTQTLCAYYDVSSLEELSGELGGDEADAGAGESTADVGTSRDIELDDGISPLVGDESDTGNDTGTGDLTASSSESSPSGATASSDMASPSSTAESGGLTEGDATPATDAGSTAGDTTAESTTTPSQAESGATAGDSEADVAALEEQLAKLTTAVKRQNTLLRKHNQRIDEHEETIERHDEKIDQLIEELRRGR